MKKCIALLLALLCLVLAGCGSDPVPETTATPDTPDEPVVTQPVETEASTEPTTLANDRFDPEAAVALIGSWQTTIVLDGSMFHLTEMESTVEMTMAYRLNGDGTYTRGVDPEEYRTAIAAYGAAVESFMVERMYAKFTAEKLLDGKDKDDIPKLWDETEKADAEEQAKRFVEGLYLDYRFSKLNSSGDYYEENGKLWFSREDGTYEPCGYTLSEAGLVITEVEDINLYRQLKLELPLTLVKSA